MFILLEFVFWVFLAIINIFKNLYLSYTCKNIKNKVIDDRLLAQLCADDSL